MNKQKKISIWFLMLFAVALLLTKGETCYAKTDVVTDDDPGYWKAQGYISEEFYDDELEWLIPETRSNDTKIKLGVDVSKYQGNINWKKAKEEGIEFAIIRVGYRGYGEGTLNEDPYYIENIKGALEQGIPVGVYMFSQAITEKEAVEEADYILSRIREYEITLPVVMDYEYAGGNGTDGRLYAANLSREEATKICKAFCKRVEDAGYTAMLYANKSMLNNDLNAAEIAEEYLIWLAHYTSMTNYEGVYDFWQYTSMGDGYRYGMSSYYVDMNYWYDNGQIHGREFQISYELNGGVNNPDNPSSYRNNEVVLKAPTRDGYIFKGWYTDANYENKIARIKRGAKTHYTLYARWKKIVKPVKVVLNRDSATIRKGRSIVLTATVSPDKVTTKGVRWTSSNPKVATVDASGKVTAKSHGAVVITASAKGDSKVLAKCKVIVPYTIRYELNGGTNHKSNPSTYYKSEVILQRPTREGYIFKGWYTDANYKNKITTIEKGTKKNYVLYAKWQKEIKPTKVVLNKKVAKMLNGKTIVLEAKVSPDKVTTNGVRWTSSNPKVATVDASGKVTAKSNGTAIITATAKGDSSIKASCKINVVYKIRYELNGGTNNSKNPSSYYQQEVILKKPTREGYIFKGWYTDKEYKNKITKIEKGAKKNYTLYAKWQKVKVDKVAISAFKNKTGGKAVVKYAEVSKADGYEIICSTDSSFKKGVMRKTTDNPSYIIKNLKKGKTYYVRVRAYRMDSTGEKVYGKYSSVSKVKIRK